MVLMEEPVTALDLESYCTEERSPVRVRLDGWEVATNRPIRS